MICLLLFFLQKEIVSIYHASESYLMRYVNYGIEQFVYSDLKITQDNIRLLLYNISIYQITSNSKANTNYFESFNKEGIKKTLELKQKNKEKIPIKKSIEEQTDDEFLEELLFSNNIVAEPFLTNEQEVKIENDNYLKKIGKYKRKNNGRK